MRLPRLPRSFRQQIVVLTATVTAVAMLLLTLVLQVVLARIANNDVDRVLEDRADAVISSATSGPGGELIVPDAKLDAGVAVYDAQGDLVAGSVPRSLAAQYQDLGTSDVRTVQTSATALGSTQSRSPLLAVLQVSSSSPSGSSPTRRPSGSR